MEENPSVMSMEHAIGGHERVIKRNMKDIGGM